MENVEDYKRTDRKHRKLEHEGWKPEKIKNGWKSEKTRKGKMEIREYYTVL